MRNYIQELESFRQRNIARDVAKSCKAHEVETALMVLGEIDNEPVTIEELKEALNAGLRTLRQKGQ